MAKRNVRKSASRIQGLILIICGTLFVSISTLHNALKFRSLRLDRATVQAQITSQPEAERDLSAKYPVHIFIKWFVDVDVEPAVYSNRNWTISDESASYLIGGGRIGEPGNIIMYGHNKRSVLGNIRALKGNEIITLTLKDGSVKDYKVVSLRQVNPSDTALLQPTDQETLTIYTCSGIMDSQRFVVRAEPMPPNTDAISSF